MTGYEEMIVDGVLAFRCNPDEAWAKYNAKQLTMMLIEARRSKPVSKPVLPVFTPPLYHTFPSSLPGAYPETTVWPHVGTPSVAPTLNPNLYQVQWSQNCGAVRTGCATVDFSAVKTTKLDANGKIE